MGKILLIPVVLLAALVIVGLAVPAAETRQTKAEAELASVEVDRTKAEAELVGAESAAERDAKLLELVQELVDETRRQNRELLALVRQLTAPEPEGVPTWALFAVASSAISTMAVLALVAVMVLSSLRGGRLALPFYRQSQLTRGQYILDVEERTSEVVMIPPPRIEGD